MRSTCMECVTCTAVCVNCWPQALRRSSMLVSGRFLASFWESGGVWEWSRDLSQAFCYAARTVLRQKPKHVSALCHNLVGSWQSAGKPPRIAPGGCATASATDESPTARRTRGDSANPITKERVMAQRMSLEGRWLPLQAEAAKVMNAGLVRFSSQGEGGSSG